MPINTAAGSTPLIWAAEANDTLTIWLAYLSENPTPILSGAHPIVRWDSPRRVASMAISPDHLTLAVLLQSNIMGEPNWLSVIDLNTNAVSSIPNYTALEPCRNYYNENNKSIIGWLDNDKIAIQT